MKRTKEQKGITLIALIITIVVLLILAGVAISSITNDGILQYAQNAADSWNKAAQDEAGMLHNYLAYLDPCGTNGHTWGEWSEPTTADCRTKTDSTKQRVCSECGAIDTEVVALYKHDVGGAEHAWTKCLVCDEMCDGTEIVVYTEYPDNDFDHGYSWSCSRCNGCESEYGAYGIHSYAYWGGDLADKPCTQCGHVCKHSYTDTNIESDDSGIKYITETCNYCSAVLKNHEQLCVNGHTWGEPTEWPYHGQQCEVCGVGDACYNAELYIGGETYGEGMCIKGEYCSNCNEFVQGDAVESECEYGTDGKCKYCGSSCQ